MRILYKIFQVVFLLKRKSKKH